MNIKERNQRIAQHTDIVSFGGKRLQKKAMDISVYWNNLVRPPIRAYIPDWVVQKLYEYMASPRLINNPTKRFKMTNELLEPWGFKPLASGTNRRAFYCVYDPGIILKIASDAVGQKDNQSEFAIQHMLKPFCPKVFDIAGDGAVALSERGEPMSEHDYKFVWAEEIFDLLFSLLARGYILEDVGSNFYKNFGLRMGFGPMLWDFPYVYKLDWRKLICRKPDPITGQPCGGEIDYAYNKGMSEIVCTRCGSRYSAKYLASAMPSEALTTINKGRGFTMGRFDTNFQVSVKQGGKTVVSYGTETKSQRQGGQRSRRTLRNGEQYQQPINGVVTEASVTVTAPMQQPNQQATSIAANAVQNGLVMSPGIMEGINQTYGNPATEASITTYTKQDISQNVVAPYGAIPGQQPQPQAYTFAPGQGRNVPGPYREPDSPAYKQQPIPGQVVAAPVLPNRQVVKAPNGKVGITLTPEEFLALIANCKASGKEVPIELIQAAPELAASMLHNRPEPEYVEPIKTVGPVQDFDHYYEDGKRFFKYPQPIKNQVVQWLINMQSKFGDEVALMLAEKLEIHFDLKRKNGSVAPKPNPPSPARATTTNGKATYPKIMPTKSAQASKPQPKAVTRTPLQQQPSTNYAGLHPMVQQPTTETIIAPKPEQKMLSVEDPNHWKQRDGIRPQHVKAEALVDSSVTNQPTQTTGLFPMEPMSVEAKEAADTKANADGAIMGFPGTALVDTLRFKNEMPKVKKAVEARFNDFQLDLEEADKQVVEMAHKIKGFIENDVAAIMGTDTNGLEVTVVRTTDHRNADCFKVDVTNYTSPVFMTVLYPNNDKVDQAIEEQMQQQQAPNPLEEPEDTMQIPQSELERFFEQGIQSFDPSDCETEEQVKQMLVAHLVSMLIDSYQNQITVPRAYKEATAYVDQAVQIQPPKTQVEQPQPKAAVQPKTETVPPQPAPRMEAGSVGAAL